MQRAVEEGLAPAPSSIAPSRFPTMRRRAGQQKEPVAEGAVAYQQWHPSVSVLFADIVDFPALIAGCKPEQVGRSRGMSLSKWASRSDGHTAS
jgi:hypothetical protein